MSVGRASAIEGADPNGAASDQALVGDMRTIEQRRHVRRSFAAVQAALVPSSGVEQQVSSEELFADVAHVRTRGGFVQKSIQKVQSDERLWDRCLQQYLLSSS